MALVSDIQQRVCTHLQTIQEHHNIEILFAVEVGSRTWHINTEKSDYDVKFIYRRKFMASYIHLKQVHPVAIIETFEKGLFDMQGWDINQVFFLAEKGNCSLYEWIQSPMRYIVVDTYLIELLQKLVQHPLYLKTVEKSYISFAKGMFFRYIHGRRTMRLKHLLHCCRAMITYIFIGKSESLPYRGTSGIQSFDLLDMISVLSVMGNDQVTQLCDYTSYIIEKRLKVNETKEIEISVEHYDLINTLVTMEIDSMTTTNMKQLQMLSRKSFEKYFLHQFTNGDNVFQ